MAAALGRLGASLQDDGDLAIVHEGLARLRDEGNGAIRQRATLERTGSLVDVVAESVRATTPTCEG